MFNQGIKLVYESFENKDLYNNALTAIDAKWIEEALCKTPEENIRRRGLLVEQTVRLIIMMV